ncbi:O-antigen ligase family protein [Bradyrhizobium canariense]|uniref:O-antigen ligase family protein n=1 Tax=Bradyrhizobium canariense TaxID=255045 RepID=UPI001374780D|nr:O-antigen ligase family protein [Bradyrhizobium canariense]
MESIATRRPRQVGKALPSVRRQVAVGQPTRSSRLVALLIFLLAMPFYFYVGSTRLSPYRLVLVATLIPCLVAWLSGSVGRIRLQDILMFLAATWGAAILLGQHGIDEGLQSAGIFVIETFGPFLFARRYIRDVFAFRHMVRCLVLLIAVLLPFALYENFTGTPILIELFGKFLPVYPIGEYEPRLGLSRAQGPFEHQILFGVVCSSAFALSFLAFGVPARMGRLGSGVVAMTVFSSLSSGAFLSVAVQVMLIVWDKVTASVRRRWAILASIVIGTFLIVNVFSNRTPFEVFISYLTFDADTSYMRVLIWRFGTESVMMHPIFGTGLYRWERPDWMPGSIDNYWLVVAVRYGIPGFVLMAAAYLSVCFGLGRLRNLPCQVAQCRKALIITLCGLAIAMCTVHVWDAPYVLVMFLLGSGMWIFDYSNRIPLARRKTLTRVNSLIPTCEDVCFPADRPA